MAKVGEGDSRWIVGNRTDGKNVDNWHWTEKDLFPWAENRFTQQFSSVPIPSQKADLKIEKTESITGSMITCNRKGKTFYVFDIVLNLAWSGTLKGPDEIIGKGSISVHDISNDEDKWKWTVKLEDETAQNKILKEEIQNNIGPVLDKSINAVLEEMLGSAALSFQKGEDKKVEEKKTETTRKEVSTSSTSTTSVPTTTTSTNNKISTKNYTQKLTFEVPPNLIYETLLDPGRVSAFTGGPAKVENKVGSDYFFFDGAVQGKQLELVHPKKIVQTWRFNTWPKDHFSNVTILFEQNGSSSTNITLTQKGIPSSDFDRTCGGWDTYFWQRIRGLFGWHYKIN